jgi:DNA-binding HxlR family transcriptional regulator
MENTNSNKESCPIDFTMNLIGGKWSMWILWTLQDGPLRFSALKKSIPGITEKMLIQQLKKFEEFHLVDRKVFNQIPPKVEYALTEKGQSLRPIMQLIKKWGEKNLG